MSNQNPMSGVDIILRVNEGTEEAPSWKEVAFQRGATLNRSADTIDVSYKGTGAWKAYVAGMKEWSIDADGMYVFGAEGFEALEDAFENRTVIQVEIIDTYLDSGEGFTGNAFIVDFPVEAPYDGELTYSITLQGNGALSPVTPNNAQVKAALLKADVFEGVEVGDNLVTLAESKVGAGYTVEVYLADGVVIDGDGEALAAGTGRVQFLVTETATNKTALSKLLFVPVVAAG